MAFPSVQAADTTSGSQTSNSASWTTPVYPANIAANDLLLIFIATDGNTAMDASGAGFTRITTTSDGTVSCTVLAKKAAGTESGTFTITTGGASEQGTWRIIRIAAADWHQGTFSGESDHNGTALDWAANTGSGANPDPVSLNPNQWAAEDTLWIVISASDHGNTTHTGFPIGYSQEDHTTAGGHSQESGGANGAGLGVAYRKNAVATEDPGTFTTDDTEGWAAVTLAIRPAAASGATARGYGQAQANILRTYNVFAQANADIKQTYNRPAQAQADIKQTYRGYAQANSLIIVTANSFAQAQADIKATSTSYGQAQADILQVYRGYAQAQADILQKYVSHAQAQALIKLTYNQHGQAQAQIKGTYIAPAQAQADIKATSNSFGQAQASIATRYTVHAQAQAHVRTVYNALGQAQAAVKATSRVHAQAQATVEVTTTVYGQGQGWIKQTYQGFGQAQGWIKDTYRGYAQAQASILGDAATRRAFAQAIARICVSGTLKVNLSDHVLDLDISDHSLEIELTEVDTNETQCL